MLYTVQEHKKKIADKLNMLKLAEEESEELSEQASPSPTHSELIHNKTAQAEEESGSQSSASSLQNEVSTAINQVLGSGMTLY